MLTRRIQVDVDLVPGRGYGTHAQFSDYNHDIVLDMLFEIGTGRVLEAKAQLLKHPFTECAQAIKAIDSLVGFRAVNFGSRKEIFQMVAGPGGCTHLAELVMESINARIQAGDQLVPDWIDPELVALRRRQWENAWAGSCIHYTEPYWQPHQE
ncbi:MAG: DUF2889 domain-containing protein [Methylocystaceae bacterium]